VRLSEPHPSRRKKVPGRRRVWIGAGLVFSFVALVRAAFLIGSSEVVHTCEKQERNASPVPKRSGLLGYSVTSGHCIWYYLSENDKPLIVLSTVGLLGVTALLALYTAGLWRETKRLAADAATTAEEAKIDGERIRTLMEEQRTAMRDQATAMRDQAKATTEAANTAKATVEHMRDSEERQFRAYIGIVPRVVEVDETMDEEMFLTFSATVSNSGQTPAYHLRAKAEAKVLPATFPLDTQVNLEPSVGLLARGADLKLSTDEPCHIDAEDAPVLKRSTDERLYFYGIVTYEDAFRKQWRQRFCYFADWDPVRDGLFLTVAAVWNDEKSIGGQPTPEEGGQ